MSPIEGLQRRRTARYQCYLKPSTVLKFAVLRTLRFRRASCANIKYKKAPLPLHAMWTADNCVPGGHEEERSRKLTYQIAPI